MEQHRNAARAWFSTATSHSDDWHIDLLLAAKRRQNVKISVVIPARNEEATIGNVVATLRHELMKQVPIIDELVVIDSDSTDATALIAAEAGADVHAASAVVPEAGTMQGKGEALWKSLFVTTGDVLVFIDADLSLWGTHFVTGLLGPLLADPQVALVRGFYDRISEFPNQPRSTEGGRVTELVARPILSLWWPELSHVVQPLAGEWAIRRNLMEAVYIPTGYGVEIATLLDTYTRLGLESIAQVDLGARAHHHQSNHDLALMSAELMAVAYSRSHLHVETPPGSDLVQFFRSGFGTIVPRQRPVPVRQRPPAIGSPAYAKVGAVL